MLGEAAPPSWLAVAGLLSHFGPSREEPRRRFPSFVHGGLGEAIGQRLRREIYLGDEAAVTRIHRNARIAGDRPERLHRQVGLANEAGLKEPLTVAQFECI